MPQSAADPHREEPPVRSRNSDGGQVTVIFVVLATALVMLGGLAYDGSQILSARREAHNVALEAARAGAQAISLNPIYQGSDQVRINPVEARAAAARYLTEYNQWSLVVEDDTVSVTVTLSQPLQILSMLGIKSRLVEGSAAVQAVRGINKGGDI